MSRVLFFMPTSAVIGGVETWLDQACVHLSQHGFEPIVGLMRGGQYNLPDRFREYHPNLKTVEVDGRGLDQDGRVRALVRCIRNVQPDSVVPLGVLDAFEAVVRCKQAGSKVRLVAQTQGNLAPMLADLRDYREWIDMVICPGRLAMETLIEWGGFERSRMRHVPNGADQPVRKQTSRQIQQPLRLGYVGRMTRHDKRVMDVVELYHLLTNRSISFTLEMVGDGPCRSELEAALGQADNVTFHGSKQHDALYEEIFPNLDLLLLFSTSEAFGIVLLEAMFHGVVPVTSEFLGFHSEGLVLSDQTCLSFPIGDMHTAAEQIQKLNNSPELQKRLSQQAVEHAQQFSWEACLGGWESALREAIQLVPLLSKKPLANPTCPSPSRLTQLGLPDAMIDWTRRIRRTFLGSAVPSGGEEWPLFRRNHPAATLTQVQHQIESLEARKSCTDAVVNCAGGEE